MDAILNHIGKEWQVLKTAPGTFIVLIILGLAGGFTGGLGWRGQELANVESLMRLKEGEIDSYRKSINDRLDKVEKSLSDQQLSYFQDTLRTAPSTVEITIGGKAYEPFAKQVLSAFEAGGWKVQSTINADTQEGINITASGLLDAGLITKALTSADVDFQSVQLTKSTEFFLWPPTEKKQ